MNINTKGNIKDLIKGVSAATNHVIWTLYPYNNEYKTIYVIRTELSKLNNETKTNDLEPLLTTLEKAIITNKSTVADAQIKNLIEPLEKLHCHLKIYSKLPLLRNVQKNSNLANIIIK